MVTPYQPPANSIIQIDKDRKTVDVVSYIRNLLYEEWQPRHTDGVKPNTDFAELTKQINFEDSDWIILYTVSQSEDPVTITYGFTNITTVITLDFYTKGGSQGRKHLMKLIEEARRILLSHRTDTFGVVGTLTGRQWLRWGVRVRSFDTTTKGMYRYGVDCEIDWVMRAIQT